MVGELIAGRYELEELVGSGGMSSVFRAHDRLLERTVALKILHEQYTRDEDYVERFRREARAAARLSHPNIVTVIDRGEQDGRQYIVFEYVEGETLKELVRRDGPLPVVKALEFAVPVARALAYAHRDGLVHRDVKPQNVLVNADGQAKVTDFGIARSVEVHGLTDTGTVMGTSEYIAPEQAQGERVDAQSDVYALGAVLYELLTGQVPYPGENFVAVALRHINDPVPSVRERRPEASARLDAALQGAMAKNPDERPKMEQFAAELEGCLEDAETGLERDATLIVPAAAAAKPRRRNVGRTALVVGLLLLALGSVAAVLAAVFVFGGSTGAKRSPSTLPHASPIRVRAIDAYDPPPRGDSFEHGDKAHFATDSDPSSYWYTETYYNGLQKPGVGLVLDAGRPVSPSWVVVRTDTPGFLAEIKAGSKATGPFPLLVSSPPQVVAASTRLKLQMPLPARYFLVWITDLGAHRVVHVNGVRMG